MELNNDQEKLRQIIETLTSNRVCELDAYNFKDEDVKYRFEILKLMCGSKEDCLQINNLVDMQPINCLIQQRCLTLLQNIASYTFEELIMRFDSISSYFYELKEDQKFSDYLKGKKYKAIPFFILVGFCAFINLEKDISHEIKQLMKKKFLK